ncbi:MAG TPA: glycine oxidase ThiO [Ktedonobacteraceae bacterium]|jgi:glycine oxidase|nr:glycine oxidase ThiO [Ktedonobacteraceae bacterium]
MSTNRATEVIIIGGGVIGSSIAYYLRKRGAEVAVVEKGVVAAEASSAAAGLIAPLDGLFESEAFARLVLESWFSFPDLIATLEEMTGVGVEFYHPGSIRIARKSEHEQVQTYMKTWKQHNLPATWLTGDEARAQEPLLYAGAEAAIFGPQEASLKPELLTRAYAEAARKLGVHFYEHTEVTGIVRSASRVTGVKTASGETITGSHLVIATGAWAAHCGEWLDVPLPVSPLRGQILALKQPEVPLQRIIFANGIYLVPKLDNTIYVGASLEHAGFDKAITAGRIAELLTSAIAVVPSLEDAPIARIWAGLRPWSSDGKPIMGKAPNWENVTVATGHGAMGISLSPVTGQAMAELITTGQTPEILRPFGVERFM